MAVLETRDLKKSYGEGEARVEALRGVSLAIEPGQMVAIMGPSGSGKSTMLALLGAVDKPSSGTVILEGVDLATLNDDQRTLIRRRRLGSTMRHRRAGRSCHPACPWPRFRRPAGRSHW